jgi:DNA-binding NtrC family response regulator
LASLIPRLVAATSFEDAATAVLSAMFAGVEAEIEAGPYRGQARLLRGVVHLRPHGSYQRLFGVERATGNKVEGVGYLTSGNVWTFIEENRCAVSVDVQRASIRAWLPEGPRERIEPQEAAGVPGDETRERMLGRDATHVHVVPLRAPAGSVDGMITLEASCKSAAGQAFVWEDCHEELSLLASVAGAFIAAKALPLRPAEGKGPDELWPVVGASTAPIVDILRAFAPRDDTILISGPTGAGKSRLARWCHERSRRKGLPFEVLDVLGVPEELQLAELFGWRRGAFTGAVEDNPGAIARAAKGTLFLDEIDKLSLKAQAGLLRFIEERSYRVLGDKGGDRRADVRILVGTNADLRAAVRAGRFREDLYYRINVLPVRLPALDERLDELPGWAEYMLSRRHRDGGGAGGARFEPEAVKLLVSVPWPGNLRQLDNIVRRTYALRLGAQGEAGDDVVVQRHHVEQALTFDHDAGPGTLTGIFWRAARAFAQDAQRRQGRNAARLPDAANAFEGMLVAAALQQTGSRQDAFVLLGKGQLVENRNHHRALHRHLECLREFLAAVGSDLDPDLEAVLDSEEKFNAP